MDRKELESKIIELTAMAFNKDVEKLSVETSFKEELKGSSLQMVALISELENELDVTIPLKKAAGCVTIGDLVDMAEKEL